MYVLGRMGIFGFSVTLIGGVACTIVFCFPTFLLDLGDVNQAQKDSAGKVSVNQDT